MGPPKSVLAWRVNVTLAIRMRVVITVMSSPPQRTFLVRHATDESQDKLKNAVSLIRTMGKVTVITGGNSKYPEAIETKTRSNRDPANTHPKKKQTTRMQNDKL
jgi:hypothetical protein